MVQTPQQSPQQSPIRIGDPPEVPSKKLTQYHHENNDVETRRAGIDVGQNLKDDCLTPKKIIKKNPRITWAPKKTKM